MRQFTQKYNDFRRGMASDVTLEKGGGWRELRNILVTADGMLKTRWPDARLNASLPATAQGLIPNDGTWYTIAPRGATVTLTGDLGAVDVLEFDAPPNATATWELVEWAILQNTVCAFIRHGYAGGVDSWLALHVFDGKTGYPTYVTDPAAPGSWTPNLPVHFYGNTTVPGEWADFTPRLIASQAKLWASRPDGNLSFCAIGRPRVWGTRDADTIAKVGEWFYVITAGDTTTMDVPIDFATLALDRRWAGYVTEVLVDGTWTKLEEVTTITGDLQVSYASSDPAWRAGATRVTARWDGGAGGILRTRFCAKWEVEIISGCQGPGTPFEIFQTGDGGTFQWTLAVPLADYTAAYRMEINGREKAIDVYYTAKNVEGQTQIDFKEYRIIATAGQTLVETDLDYAATTDPDVAPLVSGLSATVSVNGLVKTSGFTGADDGGGDLDVTFTTPLNAGDEVLVRLVPAVDRQLRFASATLLRGSGVIRFENDTIDIDPILVSAVAAATDYQIGSAVPGFASFAVDDGSGNSPFTGYERYHLFIQNKITTP